jgi:putative mRNA 3-end processing factor
MKCRFLGGANEVGSVGMLLQFEDKMLLFDYGMTPSTPPRCPAEAPSVDYALLSHAHVDHSGMIPWLCSRYNTPVLATPLTSILSEILAIDSSKISGIEGYPILYTKMDIITARNCYEPIQYGSTIDFGNFTVHFYSAGHIPGSTMFKLQNDITVLFTGDINPLDTELLKGTKPVRCDILFIEATYAGRNHELRPKIVHGFLSKIDEVVSRGGVAVVPAFGVGRTQEVMMLLIDSGYEIWLDGMGKRVTRTLLEMPEYIRNARKLRKAFGRTRFVYTDTDRKRAMRGEVVLTTAGMLDGGPVLQYIKTLKDDPRNCILLTGYQVEGTNGRRLLDYGTIDLFGVTQKVNCEVAFFDLSAHAGHSELVQFVRCCNPEHVILFHGDNREALRSELESEYTVHMPDNGVEFEL